MKNSNSAGLLQQLAPLCLRLIIGWGFIAHGAAKLSRGTAGFEKLLVHVGVPFAHINAQIVPWLELIGGIAMIIGILVRIISIPLIITMIVAMLTIHIHYGFSSVNTIGQQPSGPVFGPPGYEINLLYVAGLLSLMITGAGRISVDQLLLGKKYTHARKKPIAVSAVKTIILFSLLTSLSSFSSSAAKPMTKEYADTSIIVAGVPLQPEDISPLLVGEKLPARSLPDDNGRMINLNEVVSKKNAILIFYRGGWCPYCTIHLARLQNVAADLDQLGYQLIAISTDSPDNLKATRQKEKLTITLLSDADLVLAKSLGIAYKSPAVYDKFLPATSGGKNTDKLLPVPSVFIVDNSGTIHFEYINPDFRQRMSPPLLKEIAAAFARESINK